MRKKPKAPNGEEKKNQLDLFAWAIDAAKRTAAAATTAKEAAAKHLEELRAGLDLRAAKYCGILITALAPCAYKEPHSPATGILGLAVVVSALLTAVPLALGKTSRVADQVLRASHYIVTLALIVGVISFVVAMVPWLPALPPQANVAATVPMPQAEAPAVSTTPDEKLVTEAAQKEAAARAEEEAARVSDCLLKEKALASAGRTYRWRQKELAKCKTEYGAAFFRWKSQDSYCGKAREQLDVAARALDAGAANMCSSTGSTKKK